MNWTTPAHIDAHNSFLDASEILERAGWEYLGYEAYEDSPKAHHWARPKVLGVGRQIETEEDALAIVEREAT